MEYNQDELYAKPNFKHSNKDGDIINFADYDFIPSKPMHLGLKDLIIFDNDDSSLPSSAVWTYDKDVDFKPEILGSNIGYGLTAFLTEDLDPDNYPEGVEKLFEVFNLRDRNDFLYTTTKHPSVGKGGMIVVYSNFNDDKFIPRNLQEASDLENRALDLRIATSEKLLSELGVNGSFYKNWKTHSVTSDNDKTVYRNNAIN